MSRLIDADDLLTAFPIDDEPMLTTSCVRMTIRRMPTIEERKKGKWISNSPTTEKCNLCRYVIADWKWNESHYCPNCGADMRGGDDE